MFNNDYIMRMIEQLVAAIAKISGLRADGKLNEAREEADEAIWQFFGLKSSLVETLPHSVLIQIVGGNSGEDVGNCVVLAELLRQKADIVAEQGGEAEAFALRLKSMDIYLQTMLDDRSLLTPRFTGQADAVVRALEGHALPADSLLRLVRYHEALGRWGKAEDRLYDLLAATGNGADAVDAGEALYRRLSALGDEELARGNFSAEEAREGLRRMLALRAHAGG